MLTLRIVDERRSAHTEYAVRAQQGAQTSQCWRRYTDFRKLHAHLHAQLKLGAFRAPKLARHTQEALDARRTELQIFLDDVVLRAQRTSAEARLERFAGLRPAAPVDADTTPLMSGSLTKRGSAFPHTWKLRHFRLFRDSVVQYFESEAAADGGAKPKGVATVLGLRPTDDEPHGLVFELYGGVEMLARAPSAKERELWLHAYDAPPPPPPPPPPPLRRVARPPFSSWAAAGAPLAHEALFVSWAEPSWACEARERPSGRTGRRGSAVAIQRHARGLLARRQRRALALLSSHAVNVQRQWRAQKSHLNVLLLQMAARQMLRQRRAYIEAMLEANQLQLSDAEKAKGTYQQVLVREQSQRRNSSVGSVTSTAVHGLAIKVVKLVERQKTRQQYEAVMCDLALPPPRRLTSLGSDSFNGTPRPPAHLLDGLVAWHCATRCQLQDGDEVREWADQSRVAQPVRARPGVPCPVFDSCAIAGHPAVDFAKGQVLVASSPRRVQTIALVVQFRSVCDYMMLCSEAQPYTAVEPSELSGAPLYRDVDFSLRMMASGFRRGSMFQGGRGIGKDNAVDRSDWFYPEAHKLWINGDTSRRDWEGFPHSPVCLIACRPAAPADADGFFYQLSSRFAGSPDHARGFDGWMGEVLLWDRELSDVEAQSVTTYLSDKWHLRQVAPVPRFTAEGAIITHCGWLLVEARTGKVKMRWVTLQAAVLWFFKDEATREPLAQLPMLGGKVQRDLRTRVITVIGQRRTVRLIAANLNESLTWARVLSQTTMKELDEMAMVDPATAFPSCFADLQSLVDALVPRVVADVVGAADSSRQEDEAPPVQRHRSFFEVGIHHADTLSAFLLCVPTFGVALDELAQMLWERYHLEWEAELPKAVWVKAVLEPRRRRVAVFMLRWAQIHPRHFSTVPLLRALWQKVADDGFLSELGLHTTSSAARSMAAIEEDREGEEATPEMEDWERSKTTFSGFDDDEAVAADLDGFDDLARFCMKERIEERQARAQTRDFEINVWLPLFDVRWTTRRYLGASLHRATKRFSLAFRTRSYVSSADSVSDDERDGEEVDTADESEYDASPNRKGARVRACESTSVEAESEESRRVTWGDGSDSPGGGKALLARLPAPPTLSVRPEEWLGVPAEELAQQLTLRDERLYHRITSTNLLSFAFGSRVGHQVARDKLPLFEFTQWFNTVACIVASAVVCCGDAAVRAKLRCYFIAVATELQRLGNFNGLTAVMAGLNNVAVYRLKTCQQRMPAECVAAQESLDLLMSPKRSYAEYRAALAQQQRSPPFIPYLGVHLTDLTFIGESTKSEVGPHINFSKHRQTAAVVVSCLAGRVERYQILESPRVTKLIDAAERLSDNDLYERSQLIEPSRRTPTGAAKV